MIFDMYVTFWFILVLSRSSSDVKGTDQCQRSQEEINISAKPVAEKQT